MQCLIRCTMSSQTCIFARSPWTQRACNIRGIANIKCVEPGSVDSKGVHLYRYCKFRGLQIDGFDCIRLLHYRTLAMTLQTRFNGLIIWRTTSIIVPHPSEKYNHTPYLCASKKVFLTTRSKANMFHISMQHPPPKFPYYPSYHSHKMNYSPIWPHKIYIWDEVD